MKNYLVGVTDILTTCVVIQAESAEEAKTKAMEGYADRIFLEDVADFVERKVDSLGIASNEDLQICAFYKANE